MYSNCIASTFFASVSLMLVEMPEQKRCLIYKIVASLKLLALLTVII